MYRKKKHHIFVSGVIVDMYGCYCQNLECGWLLKCFQRLVSLGAGAARRQVKLNKSEEIKGFRPLYSIPLPLHPRPFHRVWPAASQPPPPPLQGSAAPRVKIHPRTVVVVVVVPRCCEIRKTALRPWRAQPSRGPQQ